MLQKFEDVMSHEAANSGDYWYALMPISVAIKGLGPRSPTNRKYFRH